MTKLPTDNQIIKYKERIKAESIEKRERDYSILELLAYQPELTQDEVIGLLHLDCSQPLISTILRNNMVLYLDMTAKLNPLFLEDGRAVELIKHYRKKNKQGTTKKDVTEILEQIRKEVKGDKPVIDQSQHKHFTNINIDTEEFKRMSTPDKINMILGRK